MAAIMAAIMEITENIMRRMREPSTKLHNALYFMSGMMVVILALVIVAGVKTKAENAGFHAVCAFPSPFACLMISAICFFSARVSLRGGLGFALPAALFLRVSFCNR